MIYNTDNEKQKFRGVLMRVNITEKMLLAYQRKALDKDQLITDISGLKVALRRTSSITSIQFRAIFNLNKQRYVFTLGSFPRMTLTEARAKYLEFQEKFIRGEIGEIKREYITFGKMWSDYFKAKAHTLKPATLHVYKCIERVYLSQISDAKITEINPLFIDNFLKKNGVEGQCTQILKRTLTVISTVLDYAVFKQVLEYNPLRGINRFMPKTPKVKHHPAFKDETLKEDLIHFFEVLKEQRQPEEQAYIYLLFFTLLRTKEVATLNKSHVFGDHIIVATKTLSEFKVPLSKQAQQVINFLNQEKGGFFDAGIVNRVRWWLKKVYGDSMSLHGIRTCGRQWLQTIPTAKESLIEMCLSHVVGGAVQQAYNRGDYLQERASLMQQWSDFVEECAGENFIFK